MEEKEKASDKLQWQETSAAQPIAARRLTLEEIEEHRANLARSYKCDLADVEYAIESFGKDDLDPDRLSCVLLVYRLKPVWRGKERGRIIWTQKIPVPEDIKMKAEEIARSNSMATVTSIEEIHDAAAPLRQRPKLNLRKM